MSRTWLVSAVLVLFLNVQPLIAAEEKALVDYFGNEIKAGQSYYVLSVIRGAGGGGLLPAIMDGTSSYYVRQKGSDGNGSPLIFIPKWGITGPTTIYESDDLILKFVHTNGVWVPDGEGYVKVDSIAWLPYQSWFRIVDAGSFIGSFKAYKFVFCRAQAACSDVGITVKGYTRWLSFPSENPFVFVILPASQAGLIRQKI